MGRIPSIATRGLLVAALLLGAVVAHGAVVSPPDDDVASRARPAFRVRGRVDGLVPGRRTAMPVRVVNPYAFPLRVTRVGANVTSPSPACAPRNLTVRPWVGTRRVPSERARQVSLKVKLRAKAPIACAGIRFRLHYTGRAVKWVRR